MVYVSSISRENWAAYAFIVRAECWLLKEQPRYIVRCQIQQNNAKTTTHFECLSTGADIAMIVQVDIDKMDDINKNIRTLFGKHFKCVGDGRYDGSVTAMIFTLASIVNNESWIYPSYALTSTKNEQGYVYLIKLPDNVFKIGMTQRESKADISRVNSYKNGEILLVVQVHKSIVGDVEHWVINKYKYEYKQQQNTREYFVDGHQGNMIIDVFRELSRHLALHSAAAYIPPPLLETAKFCPAPSDPDAKYAEISQDSMRAILQKFLKKQTKDVIFIGKTGIYEEFVSLGLDTKGKASYAVRERICSYIVGMFERSGGVVFPFSDGRKRKTVIEQFKICKSRVLGVIDGTIPQNDGKIKNMPAAMRVVKRK